MTTQTYVNGVTLTDSSEFNRFDTAAYPVLTSVGQTVSTVVATGPANYTYSATNPPMWLIPVSTNTMATTINVTPSGGAALGAKNLFANGAALTGNELQINVPTAVMYDGTQFNIVGPQIAATQTQQEAGTALGVFVSPGRQQFHPSAAKAWVNCNNAGAAAASYNITSVTDTGAGVATANLTTNFSSANYCVVASGSTGGGGIFVGSATQTVSTFTLDSFNTASQAAQDVNKAFGAAFGDQ